MIADRFDLHRVLRTVAEIEREVAALNERFRADGRDPIGDGIGVHLGDVMYGNIGSRNRLDFTVIGRRSTSRRGWKA